MWSNFDIHDKFTQKQKWSLKHIYSLCKSGNGHICFNFAHPRKYVLFSENSTYLLQQQIWPNFIFALVSLREQMYCTFVILVRFCRAVNLFSFWRIAIHLLDGKNEPKSLICFAFTTTVKAIQIFKFDRICQMSKYKLFSANNTYFARGAKTKQMWPSPDLHGCVNLLQKIAVAFEQI